MLRKWKFMVIGAAFAALPLGASAATILDSSTQGITNTAGIDFAVGYAANTPSGATWSADPTAGPGNVVTEAQSPFNKNAALAASTYFAVGNASVASPVTLTFDAIQTGFKLLWGSIDSYNSITFAGGASGTVTYTGNDIATLLGLTLGTGETRYERVALVSFDEDYDSITFTSGNIAFEFALAPVPVPAAGVLMIAALGGLGLMRRRKTAA